jgi:SAM-dependent methyltransferase
MRTPDGSATTPTLDGYRSILLKLMKVTEDAFGQQLLAQYKGRTASAEIIERDDNYIDTGSAAGLYFLEYEQWSPIEQQAVAFAKGRVLDIGCGAGRHSLYLQLKGFDVTAIDHSPGAIEVCKLRGLKNAIVRPIADVDEFAPNSFETILMLGNNFGLFGDSINAKLLLEKLARVTTPEARIIAGTLNPYQTDRTEHLEYHELNRQRGRMPGQIRMRVRYGKILGEWFDYLFVSPQEMEEIITGTSWNIKDLIAADEPNYIAIIDKNPDMI